LTHLDKADIRRLLPESLTTHVDAVLANDAGFLLIARDDAVFASALIPQNFPRKSPCAFKFWIRILETSGLWLSTHQPMEPLP
jgi:hypothetical protein